MHPDRTAPPSGVALPGTAAHDHQRRLLLELAVDPPVDGDRLPALADTLGLTLAEVQAAASGLELAGLARRRGGRLRPSAAVVAIEALWPFAL
jgi:hypothetical protein